MNCVKSLVGCIRSPKALLLCLLPQHQRRDSTPVSTSPSYNGSSYPQPYSPPPLYSNQRHPPGFPVPADRPSHLQVQQPKTEQVNITSSFPSSQLASSNSPSAPGHSAAPINNITNLYNVLCKASVMPASTTPTGGGETAKID